MSHFKCVPCRVRTQQTGKLGDPVGDLCPRCGAALEPVSDLSAIFGYERVEASRGVIDTPAVAQAQALIPPTPTHS